MFAKSPHRVSRSWPASRWSWFARALAIVAMMLPATGWQALAQLQNVSLASGSVDERETEFPDEGDESDVEVHLLTPGSSRGSVRPRFLEGTCERLVVTGDSASFRNALHNDRGAAACSAARLPLRC